LASVSGVVVGGMALRGVDPAASEGFLLGVDADLLAVQIIEAGYRQAFKDLLKTHPMGLWHG